MARLLLGDQAQHKVRSLAKALLWDLDSAPIPHSLWQLHALPEGGISAPLMICGSQNDPIVDPVSWQKWSAWIKPEDRMWQCPAGRHFFHYFYSQPVAEQILEFWQEATQIQCS
jgi:surfactin synthase thioesterase subunit